MSPILDVSIIILTKDKVNYLKPCIDSIFNKNKVISYEIIVISNNSKEKETFDYLDLIEVKENVKVVYHDVEFNYAAINNYGASIAKGEYLLFLNNDTQFITNEGIKQLMGVCEKTKIGSVGATLLYEDYTIQHVGVAIGESGGWHAYQHASLNDIKGIDQNRECTAVTGACLMMKKDLFEQVDGFDETLKVIYNDVDLELRIAELGYKNICSNVQLFHYENTTRGKVSYEEDREKFIAKWKHLLEKGDRFNQSEIYSANFIKEKLLTGNIDRKMCIWGTGNYANIATSIIRETGFDISAYVDNNSSIWNTKFQESLIVSPQTLEQMTEKPYVLVASMYYMEIKEQLEKMGYLEKRDFWRFFI